MLEAAPIASPSGMIEPLTEELHVAFDALVFAGRHLDGREPQLLLVAAELPQGDGLNRVPRRSIGRNAVAGNLNSERGWWRWGCHEFVCRWSLRMMPERERSNVTGRVATAVPYAYSQNPGLPQSSAATQHEQALRPSGRELRELRLVGAFTLDLTGVCTTAVPRYG